MAAKNLVFSYLFSQLLFFSVFLTIIIDLPHSMKTLSNNTITAFNFYTVKNACNVDIEQLNSSLANQSKFNYDIVYNKQVN